MGKWLQHCKVEQPKPVQPASSTTPMYSVEGARFQEYALSKVSDKSFSPLIASLVNKLNAREITESQAVSLFHDALWAKR